jgi:hypothetical protein
MKHNHRRKSVSGEKILDPLGKEEEELWFWWICNVGLTLHFLVSNDEEERPKWISLGNSGGNANCDRGRADSGCVQAFVYPIEEFRQQTGILDPGFEG